MKTIEAVCNQVDASTIKFESKLTNMEIEKCGFKKFKPSVLQPKDEVFDTVFFRGRLEILTLTYFGEGTHRV